MNRISPTEAISFALTLALENKAKRNVTVALIFESLKQTGWTIVRSKELASSVGLSRNVLLLPRSMRKKQRVDHADRKVSRLKPSPSVWGARTLPSCRGCRDAAGHSAGRIAMQVAIRDGSRKRTKAITTPKRPGRRPPTSSPIGIVGRD